MRPDVVAERDVGREVRAESRGLLDLVPVKVPVLERVDGTLLDVYVVRIEDSALASIAAGDAISVNTTDVVHLPTHGWPLISLRAQGVECQNNLLMDASLVRRHISD